MTTPLPPYKNKPLFTSMKKPYKEVVIVLIHIDFVTYLLQLRDWNPGILYPGHWGAFGGAMEENETPKDAAIRELQEELKYSPEGLHFFRQIYNQNFNILTHIFFCSLRAGLSQLRLSEGMGMGLFAKEEILSGELHAENLKRSFPVAPPLVDFFKQFFDFIAKDRPSAKT